jgi:hypothetical protein
MMVWRLLDHPLSRMMTAERVEMRWDHSASARAFDEAIMV